MWPFGIAEALNMTLFGYIDGLTAYSKDWFQQRPANGYMLYIT